MGSLHLVLRRARAGAGLLLTILLLSAATIGIIAGTLGYGQAAATVAARQALSSGPPTEAGVQVQSRVADDPAAQDAEARRLIAAAFAPAPVIIQHTLVSEPRPLPDGGRLVAWASSTLTPSDERFDQLVAVVEGQWPQPGSSGNLPAALPAGAPEELQLGDTLSVDGITVEFVARWRPVQTDATFWFGDPLVTGPGSSSTIGPLIVPADRLADLSGTPFNRWTVQPDADQIHPDDLAMLATAAERLGRDLSGTSIDVRGVTVQGDLAPTSASAAQNLATAQALGVVPIVLLLLVSVIAVVQIARLQAAARAGEVDLLVARGAGRGQVLRWTVLESVAVTVAAAVLGIGGAVLALRWVPGGEAQSMTALRGGLLTAVAVLTALVLIALAQTRRVGAPDRSGRTRQVAALGTLLLTVGAAAVTWWQLRQYGSPLVTEDDGTLRTDVVAGAAPALLLAAAAVLAMALLGPLGRAAQSLTRRRRGLTLHLAAAQVSRRLVVYAVPVVLTILAVGSATVSSMYAGTSAQVRDQLAAVGQGPDVRVSLSPGPVVTDTGEITLPDPSTVPGVQTSRPVWTGEARLGGTATVVTAAPVADLAQLSPLPVQVWDITEVSDVLTLPPPEGTRVPLPTGTRTVQVEVDLTAELTQDQIDQDSAELRLTEESLTAENDAPDQVDPEEIEAVLAAQAQARLDRYATERSLAVVLLVQDPETGLTLPLRSSEMTYRAGGGEFVDGVLRSTGPQRSQSRLVIEVPESVRGDIFAAQVSVTTDVSHRIDAEFSGWQTDAGDALLAGADLQHWGDAQYAWRSESAARPDPEGGTPRIEHDPQSGVLRVEFVTAAASNGSASAEQNLFTLTHLAPEQRGASGATPGSAPTLRVPVVVTTALATSNDLQVGDQIDVPVVGLAVPAQVAAVTPAVPGTLSPHAVLLDSAAFAQWSTVAGRALPPPSELWVATADGADTAAVVEQISELPRVSAVTGGDAVAVTDAASAVRMVFWVASAGAVLLAVTGIGAVAATLLRARRPEVAVLRALGDTPGSQARSRAAEMLGVVAAAVAFGGAAGWSVSALVIPELAASTTLTGQVELPVSLVLELPVWLAMIGLLLAGLAILAGVVSSRVRAQALDRDYREEIR